MSTHGMLPDGGGGGSSSSSAPLMPAFNPGESVFAVDTSKLNQVLSWVMHTTKKHGVDIDEVKEETAQLRALQTAPPPQAPAAAASEELREEFDSRLQSIQKEHVDLNESVQHQLHELDKLKETLHSLSQPGARSAADALPRTPGPSDFVRLPDFSEAINELRSDLRKHARFLVKVSERTGLQVAATQFEKMVIRSKLKQFESKVNALPDAADREKLGDDATNMAAYVRSVSRSGKRGKGGSGASTPKAKPATPGSAVDASQLLEVQDMASAVLPGELDLNTDGEEGDAADDSRYIRGVGDGFSADEIAAAAAKDFASGTASRDPSLSRGGSRGGLLSRGGVSQVLSLEDDAIIQNGNGTSIIPAEVGSVDVKVFEQRLDTLQSLLEALQQTADTVINRVADVEDGLISVQDHLRDSEAAWQRSSRPSSAHSHDFAIQTESPREQPSSPPQNSDLAAQAPAVSTALHVDTALPSSPVSKAPLNAAGAPSSPAAAAAAAAVSPASSTFRNRRHSVLDGKELGEKSREMFLERPEDRARKEKSRAEELAQRVPLEDFLAVKSEAEATKKALASAEISLKQLAVRVSALEETCAPKAAITVLEGNTSKRIVGLEGRLRTLSSILSAKSDSMTVDAVSASVELNAAGLVQLKERLESVLQTGGDDKDASDHLVLLTTLNRMKNDIAVMESRLAAELKDIKSTVDHSNSSVRVLQSTFAAEKLRKLNVKKELAQGHSFGNPDASITRRCPSPSGTQGMMSESGHVITNAVHASLSSSPSASRPKPRDVEGGGTLGYKGGSLSIPENAAAMKANMSWPNELTHDQVGLLVVLAHAVWCCCFNVLDERCGVDMLRQRLAGCNVFIQAIAASHAAAAHAPKTVAAVTGDSLSNVLHDDAIPKSLAPSLFSIINGAKSAPQHPAITLKAHQPQFPPGHELSGLPPPTRQKVSQVATPPPSHLLPVIAEGRQSIVADKKKIEIKF